MSASIDVVPTAAPTSSAASSATPAASTTTSGSDAPELESGGRLMVEAYAAIWIIVLALVIIMWRRTRSLEARVGVIDAALAKVGGARTGGATAATKSAAKPSPAVDVDAASTD